MLKSLPPKRLKERPKKSQMRKRRKRRKLGSVDLAISSDEIEGEKMEYVYAAMLLHSAEKEIDENGVSAVLTAAGVDADSARVKALVASLGSVDIGEAMATAIANTRCHRRRACCSQEELQRLLLRPLKRSLRKTMVDSKVSALCSDKH